MTPVTALLTCQHTGSLRPLPTLLHHTPRPAWQNVKLVALYNVERRMKAVYCMLNPSGG